jgi:hypothetical protein
MDATRFDTLARRFAGRRLSRRRALVRAGGGLAAGALAAAGWGAARAASAAGDGDGPTMLFVQAFQAGGVAPKDGAEGRYTLTLEQGLGHTIYFSDRPERIVGATSTPQFLAGLGFPPDNPPNAALVVETAPEQTEVAVLELFAPAYDEASRTATYEVAVLAEWEREQGGDFAETKADLAQLLPQFGAAHLFIDGCVPVSIYCIKGCSNPHYLGSPPMCWNGGMGICEPCDGGWAGTTDACNATFADCDGQCVNDYSTCPYV